MLTAENIPKPLPGLYTVLLILLFTAGTPGGLSALGAMQQGPEEIRKEARAYHQEGLELRAAGELEAADRQFILAEKFYRELKDWSAVLNCAIYRSQLNYALSRMDSLHLILTEAQDIINREDLEGEHFKQERIYFFRALYFEKTAQYQAAAQVLDLATPILKDLDNLIALDSAYLSSHQSLSGSIYYERRDFEMAINHYQTSLEWFPLSRPDDEKLLTINNNLGLAFIEMGQVATGMKYLTKSLSILPELDIDIDYEDYLQTYFNLIRGHLLQDELSEAQFYLSQAAQILDQHPTDRHIWHSLSAQLQEQQGLISEALENYQSAYETRQEVRGSRHPSVAKVQLAIGNLYLKMGEEEKAIHAFQKGLQVFDQQLDSTGYFTIPDLQQVNDYYLLIQLLHQRGTTLKQQHSDKAEQILPSYRVAIQAIDSLRLLYESDASKLLLSEEAKSVFAGALDLLFQLYEKQQDPAFLQEAFQYMEKSKALLLLENIRKWRNIRLQQSKDGKPGDRFTQLLEEEKNAKLDLILLQRNIEDLQKQKQDQSPAEINYLERELQKVSSQYQAIKTDLFENYPDYYQASYGDELAGVKEIQKDLLKNKKTCLISYFIYGDQSFAMLIERKKVILKKLPPLESWYQDFTDYRDALRSQGNALLQADIYQSYLSAATRLYDILLSDLLAVARKKTRSVYLVPDDILGFLAFESLVLDAPSGNKISYALKDQDYLLEHYALSYGYSATLLLESLNKEKSETERADYGGFAPVFQEGARGRAVSRDCTTGSLMYLPYSEISVKKTQKILGGTAFLHEAASLANFKAAAAKYRILQLATHACIDQQDALFNVIYFHDTTLATYEIFDIPIQADLIILSACETGNGDLLRGEGIMSLSRGFYYAGSANIVTSLWPADDYATQTLMVAFNEHLKAGLPKDRALQQAKLDYLQSSDLRNLSTAPAFWANFILIGNQDALQLDAQSGNTWQLFLLPFLGLSLILALFYGLSWRK